MKEKILSFDECISRLLSDRGNIHYSGKKIYTHRGEPRIKQLHFDLTNKQLRYACQRQQYKSKLLEERLQAALFEKADLVEGYTEQIDNLTREVESYQRENNRLITELAGATFRSELNHVLALKAQRK